MRQIVTPSHVLVEKIRYSDKALFEVRIQFPMRMGWIEKVRLVMFNTKKHIEIPVKHFENEGIFAKFRAEFELENDVFYYYYFSYLCDGRPQVVKALNSEERKVEKSECFKYPEGFEYPKWAKDGRWYHIFVDSFKRGSKEPIVPMGKRTVNKWGDQRVLGPNEKGAWTADFYGGDIRGIIESLDYFKKLSITGLYLSPIVLSQSNHRYDTADYKKLDVYIGVFDDLKELCDKAHQKGIRIILDAVFNHTGDDSLYFNRYGNYDTVGAYQSDKSPYFPFYKRVFNNEKGRADFKYWWDFKNLPECNSYSEEWMEYITGIGGIIDYWFSFGIDGLRLDVADELSDEFIFKIVKAVKRNKKDGLVIGEVWINPEREKRRYTLEGKGMLGVMNYWFIDPLIRYYKYADCWTLRTRINEIFNEYPEESKCVHMNFTSTHDISRLLDQFGGTGFVQDRWVWDTRNNDHDFLRAHAISNKQKKAAKDILMSYITALTFFPGNTSIFYGDEVGQTGLGNLLNRGSYPWDRRDKKLLKFFRSVFAAQASVPEYDGTRCNVLEVNEEFFSYERVSSDGKKLVVVSSRASYPIPVKTPYSRKKKKVVYKLGKYTSSDMLDSFGAIVFEVE